MPAYHCEVQTDQKPNTALLHKISKPPMYKVIMLNDDFTPMDFVIEILETIFNKSTEEAVNLTFNIHNNGYGICGIYTNEVAETKIIQVMKLANKDQHPLQCTLEKE